MEKKVEILDVVQDDVDGDKGLRGSTVDPRDYQITDELIERLRKQGL